MSPERKSFEIQLVGKKQKPKAGDDPIPVSLSITDINLSFRTVFKLLFYIAVSMVLIWVVLYLIFMISGKAIVGLSSILKSIGSLFSQ